MSNNNNLTDTEWSTRKTTVASQTCLGNNKSQGLTLPKAWIDIGQTERAVGISKVKTLSSCIIEPMTFERLTHLKKSTNLKYRLEEERRLYNLAKIDLSQVE